VNYNVNKKIFYTIFFISLISVISLVYFNFFKKDKIINYPSSGIDIIAFGDSLVQGIGSSDDQKNFVSILSQKIGRPIINLGVSGDTTADGLARLSELDKYRPKIVLVLLGGNDYLKKVSSTNTFENLSKIIKNIQSRGAVVILLGVRGGLFSDKFESEFEKLKDEYGTAYVPNVLEGLLMNDKYMSDAIHPNDAGYKIIADKIYPIISGLIK